MPTSVATLNTQQINTLQSYQSAGQLPEAYRYLRDIAQSQGNTDANSVASWLDRAASINANDGSATSEFVRGTTESVGQQLGKPISDTQFQNASNKLANKVISDVIKNGVIPDPSTIIREDVQTAVKELNLPPWGWAGTWGDSLSPKLGGLGHEYVTLPDPKNVGWREYGRAWGKTFVANLDGAGRVISRFISDFFTTAQKYPYRVDPLTLDLNGDGLNTVPLKTPPLLFDLNATGIKTSTGWIAPDDGLLVLDRNGNGVIDSGAELFGNATPAYASNGKTADGFAALAQEDSNHDGVVNAQDANFAALRVWQDLNQDGISQGNELTTLNQQGIASFNVSRTQNSQTLPNGNQIADTGSYTRTDGSSGSDGTPAGIADINLAVDTFHRSFIDSIPLTAATQVLPDMQGSGMVRDLREAANQTYWIDTCCLSHLPRGLQVSRESRSIHTGA